MGLKLTFEILSGNEDHILGSCKAKMYDTICSSTCEAFVENILDSLNKSSSKISSRFIGG